MPRQDFYARHTTPGFLVGLTIRRGRGGRKQAILRRADSMATYCFGFQINVTHRASFLFGNQPLQRTTTLQWGYQQFLFRRLFEDATIVYMRPEGNVIVRTENSDDAEERSSIR